LNKEKNKGLLLVSSSLDAVINLQLSRQLLDSVFYSVVKEQLHQQDDISIKGLRLSLDLLKDAHLYFIGKSAFARIPLDISAATNAVLGSLSIEAVIELDFRLDLSIENDSILQVKSELTKYRWKKKPELELLKVKFNLNRFLGKLIEDKKTELESRVDAMVSGFDMGQFVLETIAKIEKKLSRAWKPLKMDHSISAHNIEILPETANRKFNDIKLGLKCDVNINKSGSEHVKEKGFGISFLESHQKSAWLKTKMLVNAESINQLLSEFYREQIFEYQGRHIILSAPKLAIDRNSLNVESSLKGFLNGRLTVSFAPFLDREMKSIVLSEVQIDINSNGLLGKTKAFLIKNYVLHQIKKKGHLKFEILKNLLQYQISSFLKSKNNEGISSHIHLLDIDIQSFNSCNEQIEVELEIEFRNSFKLMPGILESLLEN